ncbi:MAG: 16S rRNA (guanine(527)-N(7))-methyltransferase RsmG [Chloroflexota bacterium]
MTNQFGAQLTHLAQQAAVMGLSLSGTQLAQFERYLELLLHWNEQINLTAIRDPEEIVTRHFLDSLSCALATADLNDARLIDVGSGAGLPGLPLKILYPGLRLTLVDSVAKKTDFLQIVVDELGLADVLVLTERAEVIGRLPQHRAQYDWATARAVAELRVLLEYLLPLCRPGGRVLAQKGESAAQEVAAATQALHLLGGKVDSVQPVQLPGHTQTHYLIVVTKQAATSDRYPRRVGIPAKRPL